MKCKCKNIDMMIYIYMILYNVCKMVIYIFNHNTSQRLEGAKSLQGTNYHILFTKILLV